MNKIMLTGVHTNLIDVSTMAERDYIPGDTEFVLSKWDTNPALHYFEKSEASIKLGKLPTELQSLYKQFEVSLIKFVISVPSVP